MPYATSDDMVARFGEAELIANSDRSGAGVVDPDVVAGAIAAASSIIDSYIGTRYALPLATTPAVLKTICEDLARHALYTVEPMKIVIDNRDAALSRLKDISRGLASLDVPEPAAAAPSHNEILIEAGERTASREELRKY